MGDDDEDEVPDESQPAPELPELPEIIVTSPTGQFARPVALTNRFYRGNVHTHTTRSDGDATPRAAAKWYRDHGYQFLAITDHEKLVRSKRAHTKDFITIPGVELTGVADANRIPIHTNALCGSRSLSGIRALDLPAAAVMQQQIDRARADGAITILNHPNFGAASDRAMTTDDVLAVDGFDLLEIASGHPEVEPDGDDDHDSYEQIWDRYLTANHRVFGVAVDDTHQYKGPGANPGRFWIEVHAEALTERAVCGAIRAGWFYASSGVRLESIIAFADTLDVSVHDFRPGDRIEFIGADGVVLAESTENPAHYTLAGEERYVRARVSQGDRRAWTQPYFVTR